MKAFDLVRDIDETGISGTGPVAEGAVFSDGRVAMRWITSNRSTCFYESIDDVHAIHGHNGKTRVVFHGAPESSDLVELPKPHLELGSEGPDAEIVAMTNNCGLADHRAHMAYDRVKSIRAPAGWTAMACWFVHGDVSLTVRSPARFLRTETDKLGSRDHYERAEANFAVSANGIREANRWGRGKDAGKVIVDGVEVIAVYGTYSTNHRPAATPEGPSDGE